MNKRGIIFGANTSGKIQYYIWHSSNSIIQHKQCLAPLGRRCGTKIISDNVQAIAVENPGWYQKPGGKNKRNQSRHKITCTWKQYHWSCNGRLAVLPANKQWLLRFQFRSFCLAIREITVTLLGSIHSSVYGVDQRSGKHCPNGHSQCW